MDYAPTIAMLLALVAGLNGYTALFQKREEVERARPLISATVGRSSGGGEQVIIQNAGASAAVNLFVHCRAIADEPVGHDYLTSRGEIAFDVRSPGADDIDLVVDFGGLAGPARRAVRLFRRDGGGVLRLVGGEDVTCGAFRTSRVPLRRDIDGLPPR